MKLLTLLVFLPLAGAVACLVVPRPLVRIVAVVTTLLTFVLSLPLFGSFFGGGDPANAVEVFGSSYGTLHHVVRIPWITGENTDVRGGTVGI